MLAHANQRANTIARARRQAVQISEFDQCIARFHEFVKEVVIFGCPRKELVTSGKGQSDNINEGVQHIVYAREGFQL